MFSPPTVSPPTVPPRDLPMSGQETGGKKAVSGNSGPVNRIGCRELSAPTTWRFRYSQLPGWSGLGARVAQNLDLLVHQVDDPVFRDSARGVDGGFLVSVEGQGTPGHFDHEVGAVRIGIWADVLVSEQGDVGLWLGQGAHPQGVLDRDGVGLPVETNKAGVGPGDSIGVLGLWRRYGDDHTSE